MIGSYGRHAYGGRAGGTKKNNNIFTISPKGGTIKHIKQIGATKKANSVGSIKRSPGMGSSNRS